MRYSLPLTGIAAGLLLATTAQANEALDVEMHKVNAEGIEQSIGTVAIEHTEHGVLLTPSLTGLEPGVYGFHVHQHASCEPAENDSGEMTAALSAGGHYDPEETGTHQGPYGDGHLGDLPVLTVNKDGEANLPVLAPRLSMEDMPGRSLMIHAGGDTYSDDPHLGGGGARMACGVVES
ncbi:superoxide dismutase family protein [Vreelandella venusta]|uniref:Superoxide dismutase [Cu-Zn] n=1 Tax=Vreelandella venusta TaxID=44935 RepID=A0AAQ0CH18_9GAMM|nr:superoxide dismutase family protein [Halomonas venusta]MBR9925140.1 superoxide dismutase [Gammaproteobacteria bacterium]MDX1356190.1 superoxide dismutase [Cu-Zn] SodC [Halomonas venusta]MDX1712765.1 superoxide dismutase [Cu-Zn] SodC [Halomonas venusta]QPI64713.1 superoxide dismutase family protein [Halomonas venusta]QRL03908.1 superoxide dismutase family protein [Halomonas venusta]